MSEMSVELAIDVLEKRVHREIFKFCKVARTTDEVIDHLMKYYPKVGYKIPEDFEMRKRTARKLLSMEEAGIVVFDKRTNKWKSTEFGIDILFKYFGIQV